jgi:hypothetical protein
LWFGPQNANIPREKEEEVMKKKLLVLGLLAGGSLFAGTRVFVGVGVGAPLPPVVAYAAPCPGPGYTWIAGYWYDVGPHRYWRAGYWMPPRVIQRQRVQRRDFDHGRAVRDRDHGRNVRDNRRH